MLLVQLRRQRLPSAIKPLHAAEIRSFALLQGCHHLVPAGLLPLDQQRPEHKTLEPKRHPKYQHLCGSFRRLGVPYVGVLRIRILLFRAIY